MDLRFAIADFRLLIARVRTEVTPHPPAGLPQPRRREAGRSRLCALSVHNPPARAKARPATAGESAVAGHPPRFLGSAGPI
jgi:hypothetical protein